MRTTLNLDDKILKDLMRYTDAATQTEAVNRALAEWVRKKRIDALRAKRGIVPWEGDLDSLRQGELQEIDHPHG